MSTICPSKCEASPGCSCPSDDTVRTAPRARLSNLVARLTPSPCTAGAEVVLSASAHVCSVSSPPNLSSRCRRLFVSGCAAGSVVFCTSTVAELAATCSWPSSPKRWARFLRRCSSTDRGDASVFRFNSCFSSASSLSLSSTAFLVFSWNAVFLLTSPPIICAASSVLADSAADAAAVAAFLLNSPPIDDAALLTCVPPLPAPLPPRPRFSLHPFISPNLLLANILVRPRDPPARSLSPKQILIWHPLPFLPFLQFCFGDDRFLKNST